MVRIETQILSFPSQGEAGQGGAHLEGPRCLLSAWKKIFTYNFFSLTTFVSKKFQIYYLWVDLEPEILKIENPDLWISGSG